MKALYIRIGILFGIDFTGGVILWSLTHQWSAFIVPATAFTAGLAIYAGSWRHHLYIVKRSTDVDQIDRHLRRRKKHPLVGTLYATVYQDYPTAERLAGRIRQSETRVKMLVAVASAVERWDELDKLLEEVPDEGYKTYYWALFALKQREWQRFDELKARLRDSPNVRILEAEEAFARGDLEGADRMGQEAINHTEGLARWSLVKGLETSRAYPQRVTYF